MFGMKNATQGRKATQKGFERPGEQYRVYLSPEQSIEDLLDWMRFTNFPTEELSVQEYVQELKNRSYFEDNVVNYFKGVNNFYNQL